MAAVRLVALTKAVVRAVPFQITCAPVAKLDPVTVRVKAPLPAIAVPGEIDVKPAAGAPFRVSAVVADLLPANDLSPPYRANTLCVPEPGMETLERVAV